jgi:predicted MFS family arabinose efflux permease
MRFVRDLLGHYRAAFSGLPRTVWLLAAGTLVNRAGTMVMPFLTLYLTESLHLSTATAGTLMALFGVGSLFGSALGGWLSDRVGPLAVLLGSLAGTGVGFLVLGSLRHVAALAVAIPCISLVADTYRPALLAGVAAWSPPAVRARSMSLVRLAINLGMSIGPAVGGLLAAWSYQFLFLADALTCWLAALVLWRTLGGVGRSPEHRREPSDGGAGSPLGDRPFLVFLVLVSLLGFAFFQLIGAFPLYLHQAFGFSATTIGGLLALNALLVALCEMVLVRALDGRAPLRLLAIGSLLVCCGFGMLPLGRGVAFAAASVVVWSIGEMLSLPYASLVTASRAPAGRAGSYMGAYSVAFSVALISAPAVGLRIYERFGPAALWSGIAGLGAVLCLGFRALDGHLPGARTRLDVA